MSTYQVAIALGSVAFTLTSGDAHDPSDQTYVLEGFEHSWRFPDGAPWPSQPLPDEAKLYLLTKDVDNLAAIDRGTTAYIKVSSGAKTVSEFTGRVDDISSTIVRRGKVTPLGTIWTQWALYEVLMSDYKVDLAEALISLVRPAELWSARRPALVNAVVAEVGVPITIPDPIWNATFDAQTYTDADGLAALVELLAQWQMDGTLGQQVRPILTPYTTPGTATLNGFDTTAVHRVAETWPPGLLAFTGGLLKLTFGTPPAVPGATPLGLTIAGSRVEERGLTFRRSKAEDPTQLVVTGPFGTITIPNPYTSSPVPVTLRLPMTITSASIAESTASMYHPFERPPSKFDVEGITWRPSDAELAALPFPLTFVTGTSNSTVYRAQVAITNVPNPINPTGSAGFIAGTIRGAAVRIAGKQIVVDLILSKTLPIADGTLGVTPADIATHFPTVKVNQVDPALSVYDIRLARKP